MPDDLAALQPIRDRAGIVAKLGPPRPGDDLTGAAHRSAADVPRLLKAAEAALKLADGARVAMSACGVSGPCSCGRHPVAWTLDPAKLREAITAALAGKEAGDGG